MSLQHLTLGERMVLAARLMTVEHIRQEADAANVDLTSLAAKTVVEHVAPVDPEPTPTPTPPRPRMSRRSKSVTVTVSVREPVLRQDLFRQPQSVFSNNWPQITEEDDGLTDDALEAA